MQHRKLVLPEFLNDQGFLFGGNLLKWVDESAYITASLEFPDNRLVTVSLSEVIFKHPAVLMGASFGVPDPKVPGSERVAAVIKLHDNYPEAVTEEDIREYCREHLAPYAVPKYVEFRDALPMTVTEKLFKKELREELIKKLKTKTN